MKRKKLNFKHLWIQFEDFLFPRLRLSITDRAVYSHLIRHSRLEGQLQLRFSMPWLARGIGVSTGPVRESVRRLVEPGHGEAELELAFETAEIGRAHV